MSFFITTDNESNRKFKENRKSKNDRLDIRLQVLRCPLPDFVAVSLCPALFMEVMLMADKKINSDIPVWCRYTMTIEEAAGYYHIGEGKLRMLIDTHPNEDFYVMNGNRALIKRKKFERYLDRATAV